MKTGIIFTITATMIALMVSCDRKGAAKPKKSDAVKGSEIESGATYNVVPLKSGNLKQIVGKVTFAVKDPEWGDDGPSPYVSIEKPAKSIKFMEKPAEVVVAVQDINLVIDYPVTGEWEVKVKSASPNGFTRSELARRISSVYHYIYSEEERTTKIRVIPMKERKIMNRNRTDGRFGIWGHDIGDLDLHTIELYKTPNGKVYARLGIDS